MNTTNPLRHTPSVLALALVAALGLGACSKEAEPQPAVTAASQAPAPAAEPAEVVVDDDAAPVQATTETPEETAKRAGEAVDAQRLFTPAGDNAFELYLSVLDAKPNDPLARNAVTDLFPYAVMHVEQRLRGNDPDDAERVLALMEKANADAPALPRLRSDLTALRNRLAAAEQAEAARAERAQAAAEAARAAAAAAQQTASTPAPEPATPAPAPVAQPAPAPAEPAPQQPAQIAETPAPAPAAPTPAPAPARPAGLPPVVNQVSPRYPPLALRRRVEGYVEVQFTVLADGTVTDVSVLRSEPRSMFDREAINAMQRWRFQAVPGAAPQRGRRTFDFKLND